MVYIIENECIGCGICADVCPENAIKMDFRKAHIDTQRCSDCGICINTCLRNAIMRKSVTQDIVTLKKRMDDIRKRITLLSSNLDELTHKTWAENKP